VKPFVGKIRVDDLADPFLLLGCRVGPADPGDVDIADPHHAGVAIGVDLRDEQIRAS